MGKFAAPRSKARSVAQAIEVATGIDAGIAKLARIIADFQK
jgi:hypothetical protein